MESKTVAASFDVELTDEELSLLRENFDVDFYLRENEDVKAAGVDPLTHYVAFGESEGRAPSPTFCPKRYSKRYPRSARNGGCVFLHYLSVGRDRGYLSPPPKDEKPSGPDFQAQAELLRKHLDTEFYISTYPDVAASGLDAVEHYLLHGETEGRQPRADFSPRYYRASNADLKGAPFNLFWHFCYAGRAEGRKGLPEISAKLDPGTDEELLARLLRPKISTEDYYARYRDVAELKLDPVLHYIRHGEQEGRSPTPDFDPLVYRMSRAELADAAFNLFWHSMNSKGDIATFVPDVLAARVAEDVEATQPHFDEAHYLAACPAAKQSNVAPLLHYLAYGEKAGFRPNARFNPEFYRSANADIGRLARSAFWHYCAHGQAEMRSPSPYWELAEDCDLVVTAIVPNYNHARFLEQRVRSIIDQTYAHIQIIILDDCSKDNSREVIEQLARDCPRPIEVHFNEVNAGNVFAQWRKGVGLAKGDLIWLCESDDFCEPDFVEHMVRHFQDHSVTMAFGQIQFSDADGAFLEGMDEFRANAERLDWSSTVKRPAAEWFSNALGTRNVMANVGGCMFRRQDLPQAIWDEARNFRIIGDWFLYSRIAGGGQIVYEPRSVAYFRQHGSNTSASNFSKDYYYREYGQLMLALTEMWDIPAATREIFVENVRFEFCHFGMEEAGHRFEDLVPVDLIMAKRPSIKHIQIGFLGFHSGGGEVFAIRMAEMLLERGHTVSMVAQSLTEIREDMRAMLSPRIPIYDVSDVALMGRDTYVRRCGIDLIHSHVNAVDSSFYSREDGLLPSPYVVTLHGSHDFLDTKAPNVARYVARLRDRVSSFVYTADKNLGLFGDCGMPDGRMFKISNALPRDTQPFEMTRAELGIAEDAVVFAFVARGIERKGWRVAVMAFQALRDAFPDQPMHLLLVGEGEKADVASELVADGASEAISFLGYQSRINGLYALSDCAIIPTRYPGESNPLCLIQAAQEGLPIIAANVGEIANMLDLDGTPGGILVEPQRDTLAFAGEFRDMMARMLDARTRRGFSECSLRIAAKYRTDAMVDAYEGVYAAAADFHRDAMMNEVR